jgi:hypothetical protein
MEAYKAILEALSEAECVCYYQTDDTEHGNKIKEMQQTLYKMIQEWHDLTGATLN